MYEKRIKKMEAAEKFLPDSKKVNIVGNADIVLLTWGSPKGAIADAMEDLKKAGIEIEMIQVRMFSPYPKEAVANALNGKKRIIAVENNYYAQGAEVMTEHLGIMPTNYILKWNGRPMAKDEIVSAVTDIVKNGTKKVVLDGGK